MAQKIEITEVRAVLIQYDALPNWTMTEVRYVEEAFACSPSKALRLVRAARKAMVA